MPKYADDSVFSNFLLATRAVDDLRDMHPKHSELPDAERVRNEAWKVLVREVRAKDETIERLRFVIDLKNRQIDQYLPCPDHRDKIPPDTCPCCHTERMERKRIKEGDARYGRECTDHRGTQPTVTMTTHSMTPRMP